MKLINWPPSHALNPEGRRCRLIRHIRPGRQEQYGTFIGGIPCFFCPSAINGPRTSRGIGVYACTEIYRASTWLNVSAVQKLTRRLPGLHQYIILRDMRPKIKAFVLQQRADTIAEMMEVARVAETAGIATIGSNSGELAEIDRGRNLCKSSEGTSHHKDGSDVDKRHLFLL